MKASHVSVVALLGTIQVLEGPCTARAQASSTAAAGVIPSVGEAVARVQHVYGTAIAFTADVEQTFSDKATNMQKSTSGHVEWRTPGSVTWTYARPFGSGSGSSCTSSQCPIALSFLPAAGPLSVKFALEAIPGPQAHFPDGYVLVGTPRTAIAGCAKALFYVEATTSEIRRVVMIDERGNHDRLDFLNAQIFYRP
jgi:hypothetical protein